MVLTLEEESRRIFLMRRDIKYLEANISKTLKSIKEQHCAYKLGDTYEFYDYNVLPQSRKPTRMCIESIEIVEMGGDVYIKLFGFIYKKNGDLGKRAVVKLIKIGDDHGNAKISKE